MCERCAKLYAGLPADLLEALDEFMPDIDALAAKMGTKLAECIMSLDVPEDLSEDERKVAEISRTKHLSYASVIALAGYAGAQQEHSVHLVQNFIHPFQQGLQVGHLKTGSEEFGRKLN